MTSETPDQRDSDADAGRGREEVVHGEAGHLNEVTDRGLRNVALPVGIGIEAGGGVEGQIRTDVARRITLRIKGQPQLKALYGVKKHGAEGAEREQSAGIAGPVLLLLFIDKTQLVNETLDRAQQRR